MIEYESKGISAGAAFAILIGFAGVGLVVGSMIAFVVWFAMTGQGISTMQKDMTNLQYVNAARVMQMISVFFLFFIPALGTARLVNKSPFRWLGYKEGFNGKQVITVILILAVCMPVVGALSELNQLIPLSKGLEAMAKKFEDTNTKTAETLATIRSGGEFIFSLFIMALLPAVFEETFFRGGLQQLLISWFKKPMTAIIVTSILFSMLHVSWYGFLPRFALGMVLGLIFYYSRSIWLNMLLHFLNNAIVVGVMYYMSLHHKPVKDAMDENAPLWVGLPALIILVLLFRFFKQLSASRSIQQIPPADNLSIESTPV